MQDQVIAFIGCGNLSTGLVKGLLDDGYPKEKLWVSNRTPEKKAFFETTFGVHATTDNAEAIRAADVIVLGVKPQQMQALAQSIADVVQQRKPLVISVAVGVKVDSLDQWLGGDLPIVRSMPNTPALIGAGATGLFANDRVDQAQRDVAESIHRAVGLTVWTSAEKQIDVIAALSGSGPAYFFYFIELMQEAAVSLGLAEEDARLLALQTALGASRLALESEDDVVELRRKVTSPKGTTEQAIAVFKEQCPEIFTKAMQAAVARAQELSEQLAKGV